MAIASSTAMASVRMIVVAMGTAIKTATVTTT
jgi:hypothetical protein